MQGEQAVKISYDDGANYLQHCPTLLEGKEGFDLFRAPIWVCPALLRFLALMVCEAHPSLYRS